MSNPIDWASAMNTKASEVRDPVKVLAGWYLATFTGAASQHKAKSGNVGAKFPFRLVEAGEGVDLEALAENGGLPDRNFDYVFWLSPDAQFMIRDFALAMGIEGDPTIGEICEYLAGCGKPFRIRAYYEDDSEGRTNSDGSIRSYLRFDNIAAAE